MGATFAYRNLWLVRIRRFIANTSHNCSVQAIVTFCRISHLRPPFKPTDRQLNPTKNKLLSLTGYHCRSSGGTMKIKMMNHTHWIFIHIFFSLFFLHLYSILYFYSLHDLDFWWADEMDGAEWKVLFVRWWQMTIVRWKSFICCHVPCRPRVHILLLSSHAHQNQVKTCKCIIIMNFNCFSAPEKPF